MDGCILFAYVRLALYPEFHLNLYTIIQALKFKCSWPLNVVTTPAQIWYANDTVFTEAAVTWVARQETFYNQYNHSNYTGFEGSYIYCLTKTSQLPTIVSRLSRVAKEAGVPTPCRGYRPLWTFGSEKCIHPQGWMHPWHIYPNTSWRAPSRLSLTLAFVIGR